MPPPSAQARSIVRDVRPVSALDPTVNRSQSALEGARRLRATLNAAIQEDDGDISPDLRREADDRRNKSYVAVSVADTLE